MGTLRKLDFPPFQGQWNACQSAEDGTGWPAKRVRLLDALVVVFVFIYNFPIQFIAVPDEM
ncbi:hypothetical protein [Auritidibacter ignavus]|uniref:hypothetical protein n=1 Tax=Auritidibacter ignavus TaxID=678932 RepID=UPI0024BA7069|nr:hypothetical protein [Auritidibacter ignavus]WHS27770.1 hypothetical protein QM395_10430 [Auritidibacter ignavus]